MDVYLVRHAIAFDPDSAAWPDDRDRPLTPDGEKRFRRAAKGLRELVPTIDVVLSSPLTRAWQTAEILQERAHWPAPVRIDALEPGRAATDVLEALQPHASAGSIALVGHEPSLHELASFFLAGDSGVARLTMRKGGVTRLVFMDALQPGSAELEWHLPPRVLRSLG